MPGFGESDEGFEHLEPFAFGDPWAIVIEFDACPGFGWVARVRGVVRPNPQSGFGVALGVSDEVFRDPNEGDPIGENHG